MQRYHRQVAARTDEDNFENSWGATSGDDTESSFTARHSREYSRSRSGRTGSESTEASEPGGRRQRRLRSSASSAESGSGLNVTTRTRLAAVQGRGGDLSKAPSDRDTFLNTVAILIQQVRQHDRYGFFSAPVDREEAPDYDEIISEPMDLRTMQQKLDSGAYRSLDGVEQDLELIWRNCFTYNPSNSIYYREAARLQKWAHKQVQWARQRLSGISAMASSNEGQTASASTYSRDEATRRGRGATKRASTGTPLGSKAPPPKVAFRVHAEPLREVTILPGTGARSLTQAGAESKPKADPTQNVLLDETSDPEASYAVAAQDPSAFIQRVWRAYLARKERLRIEEEHNRLYHRHEKSLTEMQTQGDQARAMLSRWLGAQMKREPSEAEKFFCEVLEAAEIPEKMLHRSWSTSSRPLMSTAKKETPLLASSQSLTAVTGHLHPAQDPDQHPQEQKKSDVTKQRVEASGSAQTNHSRALFHAFRRAVTALRLAQVRELANDEQLRCYDTALALALQIIRSSPPKTLLKASDFEPLRSFAERLVQERHADRG
jgi:hypothetical protein